MLRLKIFGRFRVVDDFGKEVAVKSKKARALLTYLALPLGKARSREELTALLWSDRSDDQARGSLRQALSGLRRDLGDELAKALHVIDDAVSLDPNKVVVENCSPGDKLLEGLHVNDPTFDEWLRDERLRLEDAAPMDTTPEPREVRTADRPSIAVLPFANISGDPDQEYFADGITEDIITELSRYNSLFVIAPNSSFRYKGQSPNTGVVGRELGVRFIVEGSVRKAGNKVRITAQLIEAETGNHLWAERYDRDLVDIFAVQDEVVSSIVTMVPGRVEVADRTKSERKPTSEIGAYDLVLRADWLGYNDSNQPEALALYERAIVLDPTYAIAHAKLAEHTAWGVFVHCHDIETTRAATRKHGEMAARLAPRNALVHAILGEAYGMVGEHDLAAYHADKAMELNPNDYNVMVFVGWVRAVQGDYGYALELFDRAMGNDPYSNMGVRENYIDVYFLAGRYQDCVDQLIGWSNPPAHVEAEVAAAVALLGREADARAMVGRITAAAPDGWDIAKLARAFQNAYAKPEDGERILEAFRKAGVEV